MLETSIAPTPAIAPVVQSCYDVLDVALAGGVHDFTDGKYVGDRNDRRAYLAAQERQAEYLLDQLQCPAQTRILDLGCGYGRILQQARQRGLKAVGITISPAQVQHCRRRGLEAYLLNYRHVLAAWENDWAHSFRGIVANGSLEHFVQVADAASGRANAIYQEMFSICRRLLVRGARFATTAIHFSDVGQVEPRDLLLGPYAWPRHSFRYQFAMVLQRTFGGWYPEPGQLEQCAAPYFRLDQEEDGTHDYHLTSEYWLRRLRTGIAFNPRVWRRLLGKCWAHPRATWEMLRCLVWDQSWAWQFRPPAPTRLLRQTWRAL